ncbi:hypothetical protein C0J52_00340 [Blattella germanica]|nr:hypothetical protein C0J52_00340 [Blattella germanica]
MQSSGPNVESVGSYSRIRKELTDIPFAVDNALKGFVMSNKGLALLEGHRVVLRRDQAQMQGKVKLLGGGGAGHEPTHVGFIGPGLLTAVVVGDIFFAPASRSILCALRELGKDHTEGILAIVVNYAGHRLSFGIAIERARREGIKVKLLIVGEDRAVPVPDSDDDIRRGLAGILLIQKIAGAMAEEGRSLDEIFEKCNCILTSDLGTIGIGVKLGTVPPEISRCSYILGNHPLEIGLGLRGEPGVQRITSGNISHIVHEMLEYYMKNGPSPVDTELNSTFPVVLFLNNLGPSSKLEEQIFILEVFKQLENNEYKVIRTYAGNFVSSLEIAGYSITLLKVRSPEILTYLEAPTSAPGWPKTFSPASVNIEDESIPISVPYTCSLEEERTMRSQRSNIGPVISDKAGLCVTQVIRFAADALISCEHQLNQFDAEGGDGDTGFVLKTGAIAIRNALQNDLIPVKRPYALLENIGYILEGSVGGISGALYSIFFATGAKVFGERSETCPVDAHLWLEALETGTKGISLYSCAKVGDRTMVDALHSAAEALRKGLGQNPEEPVIALRMAAEAAQDAGQKTIGMKAVRGKASEITMFEEILCFFFFFLIINDRQINRKWQLRRDRAFNSMISVSYNWHMVDLLCMIVKIMNAVISLCHFCELHGPSVLFVTQAFHEPDGPPTHPHVPEPKSCYGNATERLIIRETTDNNTAPCEACQSFNPKHKGFLSNDHEGRISYLSTQQATQHDVGTLVRQACTRSLSCEVSPGKEGPVFFGDEVRGHVLSYTFFLKDAQARGFQRWFSITVLMKDKFFLLNSWPFLVENMENIVYEKEQAECPQRALRLANAQNPDGKRTSNKPSRSVIELTGNEHVFPWLHLKFTWLLKAGADRLVEKIVEGLPTPDLTVDFYNHQETEEGFTLVTAKPVHSPVLELEASASHETSQNAPVISNLRHLHEILDPIPFLSLAYCLMVGRQIVLVPRSCYRAALNSDQYLDISQCNVLGVEPQVAVPQPNPDILRLDILKPDNHADHNNANNIAKVVKRVQHWNPGQPQDVVALLQAMGAQEQDRGLLDFWGASAT